ncbi:hypothetical protein GCM10023115_22930 [Pontixanthobacter gangjinensis]|uniref:Lipoprotein n=1 Tax=Pontixanthobacter gangjinensis TaxID=1028742 RepID=A0A6I4SRK2_9SPHN|nr:hypothetical protein [Pontixanthobacter gangjinensis]MXO57537.1 hypothetical protein [Pontixanthobacter gangjinensis]
MRQIRRFKPALSLGLACLIVAGCDLPGSDQSGTNDDQENRAVSDAANVAQGPAKSNVPEGALPNPEPAKIVRAICAEDEPIIFSCTVKGGKQLSVCASETDAGKPTAQYRFGRQSAEMVINGGRFSSVPYSGGGEAQIAFSKGDTRYIVFSRVIRTNFEPGEPNEPDFQDGVMVVRSGRPAVTIRCEGEVAQEVDVAAGDLYGGIGDEVFYPED